MTMALLSAEDLSSLLVFETLTSDWVREVHMFNSKRKRGETFIIFRNYRNKKISNFEELKQEFEDASFLDNVQFKSGHSHDIVSNKVGAGKTARKAARAWMEESTNRPAGHPTKVVGYEPKNVNNVLEKAPIKTGDAIRQSNPQLFNKPASQNNEECDVFIKKPVHVSKAPLLASLPDLADTWSMDDQDRKEEMIKTENKCSPKNISPPIKRYTGETKNLNKNMSPNKTELIPNVQTFPAKSEATVAEVTVDVVTKCAERKNEGEIDTMYTNEEQANDTFIKEENYIEGNLLVSQTSRHQFNGLAIGDSADTWIEEDTGSMEDEEDTGSEEDNTGGMEDDTGSMADEDSEEEIEQEEKNCSPVDISYPLKHKTQNIPLQTFLAENEVTSAVVTADAVSKQLNDKQQAKYIETEALNEKPQDSITMDDIQGKQIKEEIENTSVIEKYAQNEFEKEENEKESDVNKLFCLPLTDSADDWMHDDIGSMDDDDSEEDMIREDKKQSPENSPDRKHEDIGSMDDNVESEEDIIIMEKKRPPVENSPQIKQIMEEIKNPDKNIPPHKTGLVNILQTFLSESEDTAAGNTVEAVTNQVVDNKIKEDIGNASAMENYVQDVLIKEENEKNKSKKEADKNDLICLPLIDSADAWMHEDIGSMDDDKESEEDITEEKMCSPVEHSSQNIPPNKTELVNVLQTFLSESEKTAASDTVEAVSKQVDDKKIKEEIENASAIEKYPQDASRKEENEESKCKKDIGEKKMLVLPLSDSVDAWMQEDMGSMDDEMMDDEIPHQIKQNIGEKQNHKTGLVDVLQTFLAENEGEAAVSKQVDDKRIEEDPKLKKDVQIKVDDEVTESDDEDSNSDEIFNYDNDDSDLGSSESSAVLDSDCECESDKESNPSEK